MSICFLALFFFFKFWPSPCEFGPFSDRSAQQYALKLSKDWFFYLMMAQKATGDVQSASTLFGKRRGWKGRGHGSDLLGLALRLPSCALCCSHMICVAVTHNHKSIQLG